MTTLKEMAEAHLVNVQRELQKLQQQRAEIDQEITRLSSYLEDGVQTLNSEHSEEDSSTDD